jgi:hypothetical protein
MTGGLIVKVVMKSLMKFKISILCLILSGCSTVQFATNAVDLSVYGVTDKTITDHVMSFTTDRNCKISRIFSSYANEYVCEYWKDAPQ